MLSLALNKPYMGEGGQKVQTSSDEINKSWGCNEQQGDDR